MGLAGWLASRDKKIANDSEWKGTVNAKLDNILGISADLCAVKELAEDNAKRISVLENDFKTTKDRIKEYHSR